MIQPLSFGFLQVSFGVSFFKFYLYLNLVSVHHRRLLTIRCCWFHDYLLIYYINKSVCLFSVDQVQSKWNDAIFLRDFAWLFSLDSQKCLCRLACVYVGIRLSVITSKDHFQSEVTLTRKFSAYKYFFNLLNFCSSFIKSEMKDFF